MRTGSDVGAGTKVASPTRISTHAGVSTRVEAINGDGPRLGAEVENRTEMRFKLSRGGEQGRLVLTVKLTWEFSGSPMVKAPCFHFTGQEFDP